MTRLNALAAFALAAAVSAAAEARLICEYTARLSSQDHFNSRGARLSSPAAIIRQDRYYFHVDGAGDPEDEDDCFFGSKRNREILERMLAHGRTTASARRAIVNGTPMVRIQIYRENGEDYVNATVY